MELKKKCEIEKRCPWGCKPLFGMWNEKTNLYATDCIYYTDCPKKYWSAKSGKEQNMSGGHFDYKQYHIDEVANEIENIIANNNPANNDYFSTAVISKFKIAVMFLRIAKTMAHRIDWLISGDDSENSFHERWDESIEVVTTVIEHTTIHKTYEDLAHEIWAAAQLTPGEGIEDGVERIMNILKEKYIIIKQ